MLAAGLALVLGALSMLHVYWALGGAWGRAVAVPTVRDERPLFRPGRPLTLLVAAALLVAGLVVLATGRLITLPVQPWAIRAATWILAGVFALRTIGDFRHVGLFRRVGTTRFAWWDARLFTPLCAVLAFGAAWLAATAQGGEPP